jgi:hypothetical protein
MIRRTLTAVEARPLCVVRHTHAHHHPLPNHVGECVAPPSYHNGLLHAAGSYIVRECSVTREACVAIRVADAGSQVRALRRWSRSIPVACVGDRSCGGGLPRGQWADEERWGAHTGVASRSNKVGMLVTEGSQLKLFWRSKKLEIVANIRGRDNGSLTRAHLFHTPVAQNQLQVEEKEGRPKARSHLCVHLVDDMSFDTLGAYCARRRAHHGNTNIGHP